MCFYLPNFREDAYMPRATTKTDLVKTANEQFGALWKLVDSLSGGVQNASFNFGDDFVLKQKEAHWGRDKNVRDVLVHLYEWHKLLLNWVRCNKSGVSEPFLPKPYNWKTYGQMNVEFWQKHQTTPYELSQKMLKESHAEVMKMIETFPDDELFEKAHFAWVGTSSLGSYCVSVTSSHYDWAMKKIKQHIKTCEKPE